MDLNCGFPRSHAELSLCIQIVRSCLTCDRNLLQLTYSHAKSQVGILLAKYLASKGAVEYYEQQYKSLTLAVGRVRLA